MTLKCSTSFCWHAFVKILPNPALRLWSSILYEGECVFRILAVLFVCLFVCFWMVVFVCLFVLYTYIYIYLFLHPLWSFQPRVQPLRLCADNGSGHYKEVLLLLCCLSASAMAIIGNTNFSDYICHQRNYYSICLHLRNKCILFLFSVSSILFAWYLKIMKDSPSKLPSFPFHRCNNHLHCWSSLSFFTHSLLL